jgi:hypothetical protein
MPMNYRDDNSGELSDANSPSFSPRVDTFDSSQMEANPGKWTPVSPDEVVERPTQPLEDTSPQKKRIQVVKTVSSGKVNAALLRNSIVVQRDPAPKATVETGVGFKPTLKVSSLMPAMPRNSSLQAVKPVLVTPNSGPQPGHSNSAAQLNAEKFRIRPVNLNYQSKPL